MSAELPAGFTLDQPQATGAELPAGFTLDAPSAPASAPAPESRYGLADFTPKVPGEVAASIGSGLVGSALGGIAGLAGTVIPGRPGQGADWAGKVQQALTYQPRTQAAQDILGVASLPGQAVSAVADVVGEKGAEHSPALATIGKTSVEALPLLLGARAATAKAKPLTPKQQQVAAARDAGFKMTPEEMGAGPVARTSASIAGEPRLARAVSQKNQPVVNAKITKDLGLREGTPLDVDTLRQVRAQAGQQYESVRQVGTVATDAQYLKDLDALGQRYRSAAKDFPELARADVENVVNGLKKPNFEANSAVDMIRQLRESADEAFMNRQTGLAKVMRGGADAIEGMLDRYLQQGATLGLNSADMVSAFRSARQTIAKTYQAEKALVGENINPRVYAKAADKGKPLSGGGQEVGEFASRFERSSQKPTNQATGASFADVIPAAGGMLAAGWPGIGAFFVRPAMRALLSSGPAQFLMDPRTRISPAAAQGAAASSVASRQEEKR